MVALKLRIQGRENEARAVEDAASAAEAERDEVSPDECCGVRKMVEQFVESPMFEGFVIAMIMLNTCTLAMYHANMSNLFFNIIEISELFFTIFFSVEAVLRIYGLGPRRYFLNSWNTFDFTIVVLSVLSFFAPVGQFSMLRTFRMFRAMRFLRIIRRFPKMMSIIASLVSCVSAMLAITLFSLFGIVAYTIIGMQLFGNRYTMDPKPRENFDDFGQGLLVLIQVFTADNWQEPMYDALQTSAAWAAGPYFVGFHLVSWYLVLGLVVAALLFAIATSADHGETAFAVDLEGTPAPFRARVLAYYERYSTNEKEKVAELIDFYSGNEEPLWARLDAKFHTGFFFMSPLQQSDVLGITPSTTDDSVHDPDATYAICGIRANFVALGLFAVDNRLRIGLQNVTSSRGFKLLSLVLVVAGNVVVVLDSPSRRLNDDYDDLETLSLFVLAGCWAVETLMKLIADGFLWVRPSRDYSGTMPETATDPETGERYGERSAYLVTGSNALDFVALLGEVLDVILVVMEVDGLRVGLMLRPLRIVNVVPGAMRVLHALMIAMPAIFNVVLFTTVGIFIFAIMGINIFAGFFDLCNDDSVAGQSTCIGNFEVSMPCAPYESNISWYNASSNTTSYNTTDDPCGAVYMPRTWSTAQRNFDHIGEAYMVLFEVASLDRWVPLMYFTMDITAEDSQPAKNASSYNCIFLVIFVFIGAVFMLKLFVAVIVDTYNQAYMGGRAGQMGADTQEAKLARLLELVVPAQMTERPINNAIRKFCYDVCLPWDQHDPFLHGSQRTLHHIRTHFQSFIIACIVLNLVLMCTQHQGQPAWWGSVLFYQDIVFISIFLLELVLKAVAMLPRLYCQDSWRVFDGVIVLGAAAAWPWSGGIASVIQRLFGALRVVRLVNASSRHRLIATTLVNSPPRVLNVLVVLLIVMACYAVLGVRLFGSLKHGTIIGENTNFTTFGNALAALLTVACGEWVDLRYDCELSSPQCTSGRDCGSGWAALYFFSFVILTKYIILNVVVAVVMESFLWLYSMERTAVAEDLYVSADDLRAFQREWERLDPLGRGSIPISDVQVLVGRLEQPLGREDVSTAWLEDVRFELESLPGHLRGRARFKELFVVLAAAAIDGAEEGSKLEMLEMYKLAEEEGGKRSRPVSRQDVVPDLAGPSTQGGEDHEGEGVQTVDAGTEPTTGDEGSTALEVGVGEEAAGTAEEPPRVLPTPPASPQNRLPPIAALSVSEADNSSAEAAGALTTAAASGS